MCDRKRGRKGNHRGAGWELEEERSCKACGHHIGLSGCVMKGGS